MKVSFCKIIVLLFICCFVPNFVHAQVVINEVMHYPTGAQGIIAAGTEYVELFNTSPCTTANIGCWIIGIADVDGIVNNRGSIVLPATASIPPLGHYVIGTSSSSADSNSIDFKTNRSTSSYCATGSFILANGDGWVGLYDAIGIPVDALYWTVNPLESSKITTDSDLDDSPCITTTAPGCPAVTSLLSPKNIFLTYPTRISYGGQYVNANTFSRIPDGGTWTRAIAPSINDLTVGNCNGGAGACILPSGALRDTLDISICNGQSYLFNGINRTSAGFYLDTFPRSGGCDSIAVLNLSIKPTSTGSLSASICAGSTYLFNGVNRTSAGAYLDTLIGSNGCDSVLTLNLTIRTTSTGSLSASICPGSTYLFNGVNRTTAGAYLDTLIGSNGCDSVLTLNLTIRPTTSGIMSASICSGSSYLFNGVNRTSAGVYLDTLVGSNGCDSVLTLNLTIRSTSTGSLSASICAGSTYLFNGVNRTSAGAYLDTLIGSNGCDSVLTLNLTIRSTSTGSLSASICPGSSYLFNGVNRTSAGAYLDTLVGSNGCDSVLTLNLSIRVRDSIIITQNLCAGSGYLFNGLIRNTSGTYLDTLINIYGCDSIATLILTIGAYSSGTINAGICNGNNYLFNGINRTIAGSYNDTILTSSGTCDSIVTLNLIIKMQTSGTINQSICASSSYLFNGVNRTTAGVYLDTLIGSNGCDSVLTLNLTIRSTSTGSLSASICPGSTYLFNGVNRTSAGAYLDTLVGSNGCDSILTLNLTIRSTSTGSLSASICPGSTYLFNGVNRTSAGVYLDTLIGSNGCDSVLTLNLTIRSTSTGSLSASICPGSSYLFNGVNRTSAGVYLDTLIGSNGCDSILTLNLSIRPTTAGIMSASICSGSSYLFNGVNRTTAGAYLDTLIGSNGCDSILTLNLTIRPTTSGIMSASICSGSSYLFNGVNRTTAGAYLDTLIGSNGCDSILTLNLSLLPTSNGISSVFICEGSTYSFNGINVSIPGVYLDTFIGVNGCDSILSLNLRNYIKDSTILTQNICIGSSYLFNGINRSTSGIYNDTLTNRNGCDSLVTLLLSVNNADTTIGNISICKGEAINSIIYSSDTSVTNNYTNTFGCDSLYQLNIIVYPLPTVNAGNDTTITAANSAILIASGAANYTWNNATIGAVNIVSPSESTIYIVTGTDVNNCSNVDSVNVNIIPIDDSISIAIPSAFTPNGDGLNDIYKILATKNLSLKSFAIFNRWGELVFKTNDINTGWDGRYKGREQPIGTFVYYIEALKISSKDNYNITGTVTLIR